MSLAYSNSFSLFDPACNGAISPYSGANSGVIRSDTDHNSSLGGINRAYLSYRYSKMSLLSAKLVPVFGSTRYGHCDDPTVMVASSSCCGDPFPAD